MNVKYTLMYLSAYIRASRPYTLFIAFSCTLVSAGLAKLQSIFDSYLFILILLTHILLQVLANLANDYGDFVQGTDITGKRLGPVRILQSGAISLKTMQIMMLITAIITLITGICLIYAAFGENKSLWLIFIVLGLLSIIGAIKYTVGRNPYGYVGLGDISVFIFFGLVSIIGSYFLYSKQLIFLPILPAISVGCLMVSVLNINNLRDFDNDLASGKITLALKLGFKCAKNYHLCLLISAFICLLMFNWFYLDNWYNWLYLVFFLPIFKIGYDIYQIVDHQHFNKYLKFTTLTTFVLASAFAIIINL